MSLGANIQKFRQLKNWSVQELADEMGIGKQGIYKWEAEETKPGQESLTALAKALGVTVNDLLGNNHTPVQKATDNKELSESVYRTIVEGNTEYVLVPRNILNETQLISKDELAEKSREMERKNKQIDFYQEQFSKLMDGLELTSKSPKPKKV